MVVPVHREQRVVAVERPQRLLQGDDLVHQPLRVGEHMPGVPVPPRQVLGANNGPVGRLPRERVSVDRRRDAAPHQGLFDACQPQDLRHLRDVAEHVRQVADSHRAAELVSASKPVFEVADDRLARDEELVDEREPRADYQAALSDEGSDPRRCLRPNLEVVVDDAELAVEGEDVPRVVLQQVRATGRRAQRASAENSGRGGTTPGPSGCAGRAGRGYLTEPASSPCTKYRCRAKKTISGTIMSRNAPEASRWYSAP